MTSYSRVPQNWMDSEPSKLTRLFLEGAPVAIYRHDSNARFLYANKKALQSLGYSQDELSKLTLFDIDPDLTAREWSDIWRHMCDLGSITKEAIHRRKDGTFFPIEVNATIIEYQGEKSAIVFAQDISQRKLFEESLLLTQFAFDKAAIGIYHVGTEAEILKVNEQACKDLGYTASELCSMNLFDIDPSISPSIWPEMWKVLYEQKVASIQSVHRRKDGTTFPVEITSNYLDFYGKKQSVAYSRDITLQKKNEEIRRQMEAHLRQTQKMEALGSLAGGIAHDFNNILSAILGFTELSQMTCSDNPQAQHYLSQLRAASMRAKKLVSQILSFSRQVPIEKHPVDICKVVKEALTLVEAALPPSVKLKHDVKADLGVVVADETQVHQVVMNLCTNAYQAMGSDGGVLAINLEPADLKDNDLPSFPDLKPGQYIKLAISDTGKGMHPEVMTKIFDPYFTTKEVGEGTGLGLSIVHAIVKEHGGSIKVHSQPDTGTTFQIYFPLDAAQ